MDFSEEELIQLPYQLTLFMLICVLMSGLKTSKILLFYFASFLTFSDTIATMANSYFYWHEGMDHFFSISP
jgi:hypothetical protein